MLVRLFVGNLDYAVTEPELRALFEECGPVAGVRIPLDRESGRPRGFAFVELAEREQAMQVIERFNDYSFSGRRLAVSEAVERDRAPAPRGPGGPSGPSSAPYSGGGQNTGGGGGGPVQRRFGPDAAPANKRKSAPRPQGPKGPIKERRGGGSTAGDNDDNGPDEVPFWAVDDDSTT